MPLEAAPTSLWEIVAQQSPLFAFMCIVIYFGAKTLKSNMDKADAREEAREARYNALIDSQLKLSSEQVQTLTEALVGNTEILKRVEERLNASQH